MRPIKSIIELRLQQFPRVHTALRSALKAPYFPYCFNRPPGSLAVEGVFTKGVKTDDSALIDRLVTAHTKRTELPTGQWAEIYCDHQKEISVAFATGDRMRIEQILRDPVTSDLFYGFDGLSKSLRAGGLGIEHRHAPELALDALTTLAEATGARRTEYPENYYFGRLSRIHADDVIRQLEAVFGFSLDVPNPFPSEYGLKTCRGTVAYRVPQAIYQAWRIASILRGIDRPSVLEIGGGLGRTAFYAAKFGITDYTIIDIPMSSLAQGYFLGRVLGEDQVRLYGEPANDDKIKVLAPSSFLDGEKQYDLILNVDSLTEIDRQNADVYWAAIKTRTSRFLSINHEANKFTVADLIKPFPASRSPYWLRRGYVEELVEF